MKKYYVFFKNSMDAYTLSTNLKGIKKTLAPTPREASHCCGVCLIYEDKKDKTYIEEMAKKLNITPDGFWEKEEDINPDRMKFC